MCLSFSRVLAKAQYFLFMMIQCYFIIFLPHFELLLYFALKLDSLSPIKWVRKEKTSFFDISGLALKRSMHSRLWKNDGRPIGEPKRGIQQWHYIEKIEIIWKSSFFLEHGISVMGSVMGQFPLRFRVLLVVVIR